MERPCGELHDVEENLSVHVMTCGSFFLFFFFYLCLALSTSTVENNVPFQAHLSEFEQHMLPNPLNTASAPLQSDLCCCSLWQRERGWDIVCELLVLWIPGVSYTTVCAAKQNIPWKLSFILGCLRERLCFWLPGRTTAAFLIHWTTDNPREPSPLSPACRGEQSGSKFRPRYGFRPGVRDPFYPLPNPTPQSSSIMQPTKRISTLQKTSLFFPFPPQALLPASSPLFSLLFSLKKTKKGDSSERLFRGLLRLACCRWWVTLCWAHWTARGPIYHCGLICGGPLQGDWSQLTYRLSLKLSCHHHALCIPHRLQFTQFFIWLEDF